MNVQSKFLHRLPLEIRRQIYRHVLGQGTVHFLKEKEYMFYVFCGACEAAHSTHECRAVRRALSPLRYWGMALDNIAEFGWGNPYLAQDIVSRGEVSLLRVNRQVHAEALPVLYAGVTFQPDTLATWVRFAEVLGEQRLALVRSLRVCWEVGPTQDPDGVYKSFWALVATRMPGLLDLEARISRSSQPLPSDLDFAWFRPLLDVRGIRTFTLTASNDVTGKDAQVLSVSSELSRSMCSPRDESDSIKPSPPWWEVDLPLREWKSGWRSGYRTDERPF
ncbi:hypothetical protein BJY01DRAFT_246760 [Aspergillus pseudoustus]|uniref:DUF7730 domain-containing protein n=1 Tax=Aspergillus pseudoustus TaxID=1810923 RepID=A0ABR4K5E4_9EURO